MLLWESAGPCELLEGKMIHAGAKVQGVCQLQVKDLSNWPLAQPAEAEGPQLQLGNLSKRAPTTSHLYAHGNPCCITATKWPRGSVFPTALALQVKSVGP